MGAPERLVLRGGGLPCIGHLEKPASSRTMERNVLIIISPTLGCGREAGFLRRPPIPRRPRWTPDARFNRAIQESFVDYHEELLVTDLALFDRKLADWLVLYNPERPHHTFGQQSPLSFLLEHQPGCQRYWTHTTT